MSINTSSVNYNSQSANKKWLYKVKRPSEMAAIMPVETIVGLLHRQQLMMISGGSKSYKSWLLLQLCICVAMGAKSLHFDVNKGKVLYINFKLLEAEARRKLGQIARALGLKQVPDNIRVASLKGTKITIEDLMAAAQQIKAEGYSFIVIDPIYKLYIGKSEVTIEGVSALLHELECLAMETDASVVFAHHFSKGAQGNKKAMDRASGSGGFARSPDTLSTMSENEDKGLNGEKAFTVELDFRSFPPMMPFGVMHSFPIFRLDDSIDPSKIVGKKKPSKYTDEVLLTPLRVNREGLANMQWFTTLNNGKKRFISLSQFNRRKGELLKQKRVVLVKGRYKDAEKANIDALFEDAES
jgi:hypothetical protein